MTTTSDQAARSPLPTGTEGRDIPGHAGAFARFVVAFVLFVGGLAASTLAFVFPMSGTGTTER